MAVLCSWPMWGGGSGRVCWGGGEALLLLTSMRVQLPHLHQCTLTCRGQAWRQGARHKVVLVMVHIQRCMIIYQSASFLLRHHCVRDESKPLFITIHMRQSNQANTKLCGHKPATHSNSPLFLVSDFTTFHRCAGLPGQRKPQSAHPGHGFSLAGTFPHVSAFP